MDLFAIAFIAILILLLVIVVYLRLFVDPYGKPSPVRSKEDITSAVQELLNGNLAEDHFFTLKGPTDQAVIQVMRAQGYPVLYLTSGSPQPLLREHGFSEGQRGAGTAVRVGPKVMVQDEDGLYVGLEQDPDEAAFWCELIFREVFSVENLEELTLYRP